MLIKRETFAVTLGGLSARHLPKSSDLWNQLSSMCLALWRVAECSNPWPYHTYSEKTVSFKREKSCSLWEVLKKKTKKNKNWILDKQMFPQAPEGFTRLIITNMKLELIFYKLLFPSNYISFNFHFIPFFPTCFWSSILYYREVSSCMHEASHRQPREGKSAGLEKKS